MIRQQISDHPIIKVDGNGQQIKRFVECEGFKDYSFNLKLVTLKFYISLECPEGTLLVPKQYVEYTLHNDIWFNTQGQIVASNDPTAVITEYDYWMYQMLDVACKDRELIQLGILNLDQNFHFFNQF